MLGTRKNFIHASGNRNCTLYPCSFLTNLKGKCLSRPGNEAFWLAVKKSGTGLGLISNKEARQQGGISTISEGQAEEVRQVLQISCFHRSPVSNSSSPSNFPMLVNVIVFLSSR